MRAFTFSVPTNVHFGKDVEQKAGELIKELDGSRVLVHYGSFAKKAALWTVWRAVWQRQGSQWCSPPGLSMYGGGSRSALYSLPSGFGM